MSQTTTMTVRLSGDTDACQSVGKCTGGLIRRDRERVERKAFDRLTAELAHAFSMSDATYRQLTAAEVIARNQI